MAAEQLTDKENQFKKRARRRLVGAVALVLLMITVLPLVLDDRSGQKTPQPEIAINIPSQDAGDFNSKIIPVTPSSAVAKPMVQMTSPLDKPEESANSKKNVESHPAAADKAKPEMQAKSEASAPTAPQNSAPESSSEVAKQSDTAKKADEPKAKETKLANATVRDGGKSAQSSVKKGSVSVQIGVFSDAAKVKQLRAKIAEQNVQCYTENLQTPNGVKIRLRCGPYPGRPEAQQALERVKTAGFDGILVTNQ